MQAIDHKNIIISFQSSVFSVQEMEINVKCPALRKGIAFHLLMRRPLSVFNTQTFAHI